MGALSIILFFIGLAVSTFTEKNYWEHQEMSASEKKENDKIIRNIQKNYQNEAKAYQKSVAEQEELYEKLPYLHIFI